MLLDPPVAPEMIVVVVVVDELVTLPGTHLPLEKMSPNLLEQVLHPTPPSLKVKANDPTSQAETQLFPLATNPLPQLAHTLLGSTPTAI